MATAYLIDVAYGSSLDQRTNNFTLFNLVERVALPHVPQPLPLELHAYFDIPVEERRREHELRFVLLSESGTASFSRAFQFTPRSARHRLRATGMVVQEFGRQRILVETRLRGEDDNRWTRSVFSWPLEVRERAAAANGQRGPAAGGAAPAVET